MTTPDIAPALRTAILADSGITTLLGTWNGAPSVHTRSPTPEDAGYPMVVISPDITHGNFDAIAKRRHVVVRDLSVYGDQPKSYRVVESAARFLRTLFHRDRESFTVSGFKIIDVTVEGPRIGPADDVTTVSRIVTLTVRLQPV